MSSTGSKIVQGRSPGSIEEKTSVSELSVSKFSELHADDETGKTKTNSAARPHWKSRLQLRLVKAQDAYRGLAAEMRAFANGEYEIAGALLRLSKNPSIKGHALHDAHQRVERLLRVRAIE